MRNINKNLFMNDYFGLPIQTIGNQHLKIDFLTTAGPRIVGFRPVSSGENLFAETPDIKWDTPHGIFNLWGGHRFRVSPQNPNTTTIPDDEPPEITLTEGTQVEIIGPIEKVTGLQKTIVLSLYPDRPAAHVNHILLNYNDRPITLSVWALTQLPLGGFGILPQNTKSLDSAGLLPNRNLVLWPYSNWNDERIRYQDDYHMIIAKPDRDAFKIGYLNQEGWIGYVWRNYLFLKKFQPETGAIYPDMGCNTEIYIQDRFIELETLGPLVDLRPGEPTSHDEIWEIHQLDFQVVNQEQVLNIARISPNKFYKGYP
jgi:hypothetical protein